MEPEFSTYMLYGIFSIFIFLGLLYTVAKRLGSSKNFPTPKENREREEKNNDPASNRRRPETGKGVDGGAWEGMTGMAVKYDGGKKTYKWCEGGE